ncbi:MAG: ABC transporter permease, partial [Acidobacteriota bacterium]|nr:ABC transporter permease [Acidobacteriota bacterium]
DQNILGRQITLDGESYMVIGVMPRDFGFPPFWSTRAEMWAPLVLANQTNQRNASWLRVFGRLKDGVTREQAQAEMDAICKQLEMAYPQTNTGVTVRVDPLHEKVVGDIRPALLILLGAVCLVLLIACANIANLLLARAATRQKEMAIRTALGASRFRVIRQLLTESVLLALSGGVSGLLLAFWIIDLLTKLLEGNTTSFAVKVPRLNEIGVDLSTLGFTLIVALLTGVIFGLIPALQASRQNVNETLKEGGRGATEGRRGQRLRNALIVAEMSIAVVLLIGGGLMMRSFLRLRAIDPGFNPSNVLTLTVSLAGAKQYVGLQREAFYRGLLERIKVLPGVQSASAINHLPLAGDVWGFSIAIEGRPLPSPGKKNRAVYRVCWPDYFQTMGMSLQRGRDFTDRDVMGVPGVAIINETAARRHWPGDDPLGKRFTIGDSQEHPEWLTIVGVVKDVKQDVWAGEPSTEVYLPFLQSKSYVEGAGRHTSYMTIVMRTATDPLTLTTAVQNTVWSIDKNLPVASVASLEQVIADAVWQPRFNLLLIGVFAVVALLLSAVGLYGVIAYFVAERTHEIGIRMALGAQTGDVLKLVVGQGMVLALVGVGIGLVGAFALTRVMASLLYGVSATDPLTFVGVAALLMVVAVLACYVPARRATKVDPMVALRHE